MDKVTGINCTTSGWDRENLTHLLLLWMQLLHEHQVNGTEQAAKCSNVIPVQAFVLKENSGKDAKHCKTNNLLDDFELYQRERSSIVCKADTIGWYLATIFQESHAP